jgi:hypothetical protein
MRASRYVPSEYVTMSPTVEALVGFDVASSEHVDAGIAPLKP